VSGGDALVEIRPIHKVDVKLNGRDVSGAFHEDSQRGSLVGLVAGLRLGANTLGALLGVNYLIEARYSPTSALR